jgi:Protein of unknown function (DUF3102)
MTGTALTTNPILTEHATEIRRLGKRVVGDVIEIGRRLVECRDNHLKHGEWLSWLEKEFGWTDQTARNFINVYEQSKSKNFLNLDLPVSSLYLLSAPSTPEAVREEVTERVKSGEVVNLATVKATIAKQKALKKAVERRERRAEIDQIHAGPEAAWPALQKKGIRLAKAMIKSDPKGTRKLFEILCEKKSREAFMDTLEEWIEA